MNECSLVQTTAITNNDDISSYQLSQESRIQTWLRDVLLIFWEGRCYYLTALNFRDLSNGLLLSLHYEQRQKESFWECDYRLAMCCLKAKDFGTLGRFLSYHLCLACFVNYGYGSAYEKSDSLNVSPPFFFLSFWWSHFFEHAPFFSFPTPLPFPESALLQLRHHKKIMIVIQFFSKDVADKFLEKMKALLEL